MAGSTLLHEGAGRWYRAPLVDDMSDFPYRALGALSRNAAFRALHRLSYEATDGRWIVGRSLGVDTVLLTVTGRRSGRSRTLPLYAFRAGAAGLSGLPGSWAVVATNGGAPAEPRWSLDLRATPSAVLRHRDVSMAVVAREATEDEWVALWPSIVAAYPGYEGYRRRRPAGAPILILEPAASVR